jgi:hypothetical protein
MGQTTLGWKLLREGVESSVRWNLSRDTQEKSSASSAEAGRLFNEYSVYSRN